MRSLPALIKLIRPQHWIKNIFVLAPLIFSHNLFVFEKALAAAEAAILFCLLSSAIYVFNDINDAASDREHRKNRLRPIASGAVNKNTAWILFASLMFTVSLSALLLLKSRPLFFVVLGIYAAINIGYSLRLKHIPIIEMFIVASGFILRLFAGGIAIGISLSNWILITTGLVSLLLVAGKRRADLAQENDPLMRRKAMAGYEIRYLDPLMIMLSAATLVSYLMFCTSDYGEGRFGQWVILTGVFVTFGIFRFLQIVIVQKGGDSPTTLVIRDPMMAGAILGWILSFFILIYAPQLISF